jgi:cyclic-di-AMP phosphodiesterase PgpH
MFIPRTLAETEARHGRGRWIRAFVVGTILAVALFAILTVSIATGQSGLAVGDVASGDIRAPRSITFESELQTAAKREEAASAVEPVYEPVAPLADIRNQQLAEYDSITRSISAVLARRDVGTLAQADVPAELERLVPELTALQVQTLAPMPALEWERIRDAGRTALVDTYSSQVRADELATIKTDLHANITSELADADRQLAGDLAANRVVPTLEISAAETQLAQQQARDAVQPVMVTLQQGEVIVRDGAVVTALELEQLQQLGLTQQQLELNEVGGNALIAALLSTLLVGFLWRFEPRLWFRNRSLLLFSLALLLSAIAVRVAADGTFWAYVVPTSASVLLVAILLDAGAGMAMAAILGVLSGVMNQGSLGPAVYVVAGGIASVIAIAHAERLNAFARAAVVLAVTNVAVSVAFSLLGQGDLGVVAQGTIAAGVNALLAVFGAAGSFMVLGNVFGIMTVFQLLELANPSSRLLRRLLLETPGTYHHSVMVGNLAERAAETIGADPLLARVAAYYHDIGKMKNPLAFIENQAGQRNIHDDLSAEVSARIISGHIRDGIDLGYEHGLPVKIIGFIPQHHGTSVMKFFYGKALREVGGNEELVSEETFRYPGPKPQSREAAILMLSDGVEASVRSLDDKDEASIRAMVDRIVDARVEDGQLDDAELTLKNIAQIKEAFVQQLLGMYHSRIKYPENVVALEQQRREQA